MSQQTATLPQLTDRQKRLLWLSYRHPQLLREFERQELAKLEGLAAAARDVIAAGQTAVLSERDPFVVVIIDDVLREPQYTAQQLDRRRERLTVAQNLAQNFFGDDAIMAAGEPDGGMGNWPETPARSNEAAEPKGSKSHYTPTPNGLMVKHSCRWSRKWETDRREYYVRVKRETAKAHAEMAFHPMYFANFDDLTAVNRWLNSRRQAQKRAKKTGHDWEMVYMVYPFVGETAVNWVIVSNQANGAAGEIPADRTAAFDLFYDWSNTPEETRLDKHSQGYGRQWQGMKGDGRLNYVANKAKAKAAQEGKGARGVYFHTDTDLAKLQEATKLWGDFVPAHQIRDYFQAVKTAVPDFHPAKKEGENRSFTAVVNGLIAACTQLRDTED